MKKITLILTMLFIAAFSWQSTAQTIVIGTGTEDSNGNDSDPIDGYFKAFKYQVVYTAAELSASLTPYDEITALGFSVSEDYGGGDLLGYTIKMGHTTASNSATHDTSLTMEVKAAHDYDPTVTTVGVFDMITFDTNFVWNGVDNVLIEICTDGSNPYTAPRGGVRTTLLADGSRRYRSDSTTACDKNTNLSNPERPNIQFNYIEGTPPTCLAVSSITTSAITATDVTIAWTENNTVAATAWEYVIQAPGTGEPTGAGTAANANPFTDMSLTAETDYEVYVRADCGALDFSAWAGPVTFTTSASCIAPSAIVTSAITVTDVTMAWTENNIVPATAWEYVIQAPGTGEPIGSGTVANANPFTDMSLAAETDYEVYVRVDCGASDYSAWAGPVTFTTPCATIDPATAYTQDFVSMTSFSSPIPNCWMEATNGDLVSGPTGLGSGAWSSEEFAHVGTGGGAMNINLYGTGRSDWLLTPNFDLSAGGYEVKLDVALTEFNNTNATTFGSDDQVQLLYTEDGGTTWNNLQTWAAGSEPATAGETVTIMLASTGTSVQFALWGTDGATSDAQDNDFHIDNFIVQIPPVCGDPTALAVSAETATGATFAWTENNTTAATEWDLYIVPAGDPAPTMASTPTVDDATDATATVWAGGVIGTSYDAYVRADCAADNTLTSAWVGPVNFTTLCAAIMPDYTQNFASMIAFASPMPNCWEEADNGNPATGPTDLGAGGWHFEEFAHVGGTGGGALNINLFIATKSDWILSPEFDLSAGGYELVFDVALTEYNNTNATAFGSDDQVQLLYTEDGTTWTNLQTWAVGSEPSNTGDTIIIPLTSTGTTVQFAFWGSEGTVDDAEDVDFHLDNFKVRTPPACYDPSALTATGITDTDATFAWTENVLNMPAATTWDLYIVPTGDAAPTMASTPTIDDATDATATTWTGGTASLTYDAYVRADCDSDNVGVSTWFGPYTFSMTCDAFGDFTENFDATADGDLTNCWSSIVNSTSSFARVTVEDASGTAFSGNNKVELYNGDDFNSQILLITPELTDLLNGTHRIRFMARGNQIEAAFIIGTMSDATDVATFIPMAAVALTDTYAEYSVLFDGTYPAGHKYIAFMHGNDGTNDTDFQTLRIDDFSWEPIPTCLEVSDIVLSGLTATSVTMAWTENNITVPATAWEYVIQAPGTGEPTGAGTAVGTNPFTDMSLTPDTDYEVYVRADCTGGDYSVWVGPVTFTTPCAVMTPYYSEGFTTFVPNCWTNNTISGVPSWKDGDFGNTVGDKGARINLYSGNTEAELLTPSFDLSAGGYELLIDVAVTNWNTSAADTMGSDDAVQLLYTEDAGANWINITTWNVANQPATAGETFTVALTSTAASVQFKVQATTGPTDDLEDYDFHIDNFIVRTPPSCFEPSDLAVTAITDTDATFSWTENPLNTTAATEWDLYIVPNGDAAPNAASTPTIDDATDATATVWSGGMADTTYDVYYRADCGANNTEVSVWIGPVTFQTECTAFTAPFIENFENAGTLPDCWRMTGGEDWQFDNDVTTPGHVGNEGVVGNTSASGGYFAWVDDSGAGTNDVTLRSPFIDTSSLTEPALYFYLLSHNEGNSNATLTVEVYDGAAWNLVGTYNSNTADWEQIIVPLNGLTITGNIQVRFVIADSGEFYDDIAIDDVEVKEAPSCYDPTGLMVANIDATAGTVDLGWTDNNGTAPANGWEYEIVDITAGGVVTGTGIAAATNPFNVSGLTAGNQYEFLVRAICGVGDESAWSAAFAWTQIDAPGCATNPTPTHQATDVVAGLITFSWDAPMGSSVDSYDIYAGTDPLALSFVTNVTAITVDLTVSLFGTTIYWQVVPKNVNGSTTGCAIWEFTMEQAYTDGCSAYTSSPNAAITTGVPVDDTITVSTGTPTFVVDDLDVIVNIPHTFVADLTITLTSPAGTAVVIYDGACSSNDNLNVTFDDDGTAIVCATPVSGVYIPENALSAFNGEVFDGDWTLNVTDGFGGDDGTLVQWCLMPTLGDPAAITDLDAVGFNYYPNPVSKELTMTANETIKSVTIFNMLGQEVKTIRPSTLEATIDLSTLATGTYFVKAQVGEAVGTFKVVKQ